MEDFLKALTPITSRVRTDISAIKNGGKIGWRKDEPLTEERLKTHLNGGVARGVCPIKEGESTTKVALLDLDSHKGETSWPAMVAVAELVIEELKRCGMNVIPWRSSGGKGIHIFMLWDSAQDAYSVREFLTSILFGLGYRNGTGGVVNKQIEIFPKQDSVAVDGYGNMFILPLSGQSVPLEPLLGLEPMAREYALILDWTPSPSVPILERPAPSKKMPRIDGYSPDLQKMRYLLGYISPDIDYDSWVKVGMALHHETGGSDEGLDLWDEYSSRGISYPGYEELKYKWNSFHNNKDRSVTIGTIKHMAHQGGWSRESAIDFENLDCMIEQNRQRFEPISAALFAQGKPPGWLVKKVLPQTGIAMIFGKSGTGKSFFALDIVAAIARGENWYGHKVKKGKAVYIAAEGADGFRKRLIAYAQYQDISLENLDLQVISDAPNLRTNDDKQLIEAIKNSGGAAIIVIDTLAQVTPGANENAGEDMGEVLGRCRRLYAEIGALVLLVHHSGKDQAKGARGWSGIRAAVDTEIEVVVTAQRNCATITKQKDGDSGAQFVFKLTEVTLSQDEDGENITSCAVCQLPASGSELKMRKPQGRLQTLVYGIVEELCEFETNISVEEVINKAKAIEPYDPGPDPEKPERDRRRDKILRALKELASARFIIIENNTISLPQSHKMPQMYDCGDVAKPMHSHNCHTTL